MRSLIITIALLVVVFSPKNIAAQANNGNSMPLDVRTLVEERIERNEEKREAIRLKIEEKTATREAAMEQLRAKLEERAQNRIQILFGKVATRMNSAISRLYTLIKRMEARLAIFADEKESVEDIQGEIDSAKELLASAEKSLAVANTGLEKVVGSEDPKAGFVYIRDAVKDIKSTLVDVHSILVQVIGDMKGLRVGATENL